MQRTPYYSTIPNEDGVDGVSAPGAKQLTTPTGASSVPSFATIYAPNNDMKMYKISLLIFNDKCKAFVPKLTSKTIYSLSTY